jgi:hypothetical protein
MVMSKDEFSRIFEENSLRIEGRRPDPHVVTEHFKLLMEILEFTGADDVVPIFFRGENGGLDCDFQPIL